MSSTPPVSSTRRAASRSRCACRPATRQETVGRDRRRPSAPTLIERVPLVDEILVVDDHSSDRTAAVAAAAGAKVLRRRRDPARVRRRATARARRCGSRCTPRSGDLIVWCDADVRDFDPTFVVGLIGPLLARPDLVFVKGFYERPPTTGRRAGRPGHRAGGPADRVAAVPPPGAHRAAPGRRVRRSP